MTRITVCVCTYRRPELLARLLNKLAEQSSQGLFAHDVVIADDDPAQSARLIVEAFAARTSLPVVYCSDPRQNIALARNNALRHAKGDYVAFIDDDEFPEPDWLLRLLRACEQFGAAGILGPVRPHFDAAPPAWLVKGRFCDRPEHPTGLVMRGEESRTGNVLFRRAIVVGTDAPFRADLGSGGEDKDFFMRMVQQGHVFRWCNEAIVHETVAPERWTRSYYLRRALLRGRSNLKLSHGRSKLVATSLLAAPLYIVALPFSLLAGQHVFMNCSMRFCDHAGRLLSLFGLNPVSTR